MKIINNCYVVYLQQEMFGNIFQFHGNITILEHLKDISCYRFK